jgi:ferredoxin, 2Fe-2S
VSAPVRVEPIGVTFELLPGENLMAAAARAGYSWPTICKGNAQCNRCAVRVVEGEGLEPRSTVELAGLRAVKWRGGHEDDADRLACQLTATGHAVVHKRGVRPLPDHTPPTRHGDDQQ